MGWAICSRVRQPLIPVLDRLADGFARSREFANLLIDGGEDSLSRRADITTRCTTGRADAQEPSNITQREPEAERLPHKRNAIHN